MIHTITQLRKALLTARDFEKQTIDPYSALRIAASIVQLQRSSLQACRFVAQDHLRPRDLIYCNATKKVTVIALCGFAALENKGSYKKVLSACSFSPDNQLPVAESSAYAVTEGKESVRYVLQGIERIRRLAAVEQLVECSCSVQECAPIKERIHLLFRRYSSSLEGAITDARQSFTIFEKLIIMKDIIHAVNHLHENRLVHHDIKAANTLIYCDERSGRVRAALHILWKKCFL